MNNAIIQLATGSMHQHHLRLLIFSLRIRYYHLFGYRGTRTLYRIDAINKHVENDNRTNVTSQPVKTFYHL